MDAMAFQITGVSSVYSTVCLGGADERKQQSSTLLAYVREFTGNRPIPRTKGQ